MLFDVLTFVKRYQYLLTATLLIICGVAIRLALTLIGWPHTNSEEGTMGLEAMHILLHGEHPAYLYGQHYMGADEAYIGALAFRIFGISLVALRLGMIALYAVFLGGVFWLAHLLYSRRVALISLAVLVCGTPFVLQIELLADGGKAETLAFGAMMFALATWLALSHSHEVPARSQRRLRVAAFAAWGTFAGLALYTYAVAAPFVLTSGLLLWLTCRRELRGWLAVAALGGLLIGLLPALIYTATVPFGDNPVAVFLSLHHSLNARGDAGWLMPVKQVEGTLLYTLPTVTGLVNLYPPEALPLYGPLSPTTLVALLVGGGWSLVYLSLLTLATARPLRSMRLRWPPRGEANDVPPHAPTSDSSPRHQETPEVARLLLALTAWLTIAAYMVSPTAANNVNSGRYMIGLLVVLPALLWPLVEWAPSGKTLPRHPWRPIAGMALAASLVLGAVGTVQAVPDALVADQKDLRFAHALLSHGITRFYSDYWTCDLMIFATRERLICGVVGDYAQPGLTRYPAYYATVQADPHAPYVLSHGSSIEATFLAYAAASHRLYHLSYIFGRYRVYTTLESQP
ncbi:MAG TPA: hypothetical protein VFN11_05155 [Ktedonobacterales bacterium]|nr:hypothetical protein [Ktedonobacterales bacterium]